jgi:hypothetical protein
MFLIVGVSKVLFCTAKRTLKMSPLQVQTDFLIFIPYVINTNITFCYNYYSILLFTCQGQVGDSLYFWIAVNFAADGVIAFCGGCLVALVKGVEGVETFGKRGSVYYSRVVKCGYKSGMNDRGFLIHLP